MKRIVYSVLVLSLLPLLSSAKEALSTVQFFAAKEAVRPGERLPVAVKITLADGWHTYAKEPGDSGMPPTITISGVDGLEVSEWLFPPHQSFTDLTGTSYGYEHEVVLLSDILIPETVPVGSKIELTMKINWMICRDLCVFQKGDQRISIQCGAALSELTAEWMSLLKKSGWDEQIKK